MVLPLAIDRATDGSAFLAERGISWKDFVVPETLDILSTKTCYWLSVLAATTKDSWRSSLTTSGQGSWDLPRLR